MKNERHLGSENSDETSEPVHAPVPGTGRATKRKSPINEVVTIFSEFFSALRRSQPTIGLNGLNFSSQSSIFGMNIRINGMGTMFPMMHTGRFIYHGSPSAVPRITPPRSSTSGSMDIKNT